jgi:hypothetical protein
LATRAAKIALEMTTGRQNLNIHGAFDLETGRTVMREAMDLDAISTNRLLGEVQIVYTSKRHIHLFLDNARDDRIKLWFIPTYRPH